MSHSVLITGATGGLGLGLVAAFRAAGYCVRATGRSSRFADYLASQGAEFVRADLTAQGAAKGLCEGMDAVVHAAALSTDWGDAAVMQAINVRATEASLGAARDAGCSRFIFISSPSIYAAMRDQVGLTEADHPAEPLNHYARTKLAAERIVLAANNAGFRTCSIRPRALVGPDDQVLLPRLAAMAAWGWMPLLRGGRALIELTDVRDAAQAIVQADENIGRIAGRAVNISGGKPVEVRLLAARLAEALGLRLRFVPIPMRLARWAAIWMENHADARPPLLTRYSLATLAYSQTFDLTVARDLLGYRPQYDGLATLLDVARTRAT